jgi:hypothetical protein
VSTAVSPRTRAALAALLIITPAGLVACDEARQEANAAANAVELARYLPADTMQIQTVDVVRARSELDLPEDANALPTSNKTFPRPKSPEATLFDVTSNAYGDVAAVFKSEGNGRGATPLDGTLIRAAAGATPEGSVVSTAEPIEDVEKKLELAGYSRDGKIYVAGKRTPAEASRFVADAGSGRIVFANELKNAQEILRRVRNGASPGEAAEALEPATGSVRLAITNEEKHSCVTALAAAMEATDEGAALALIISGDKPDPDRFIPQRLKGLAAGTPTVLVDALLVPIRVKKPLKDGLDPITQAASEAPFDSYDCP